MRATSEILEECAEFELVTLPGGAKTIHIGSDNSVNADISRTDWYKAIVGDKPCKIRAASGLEGLIPSPRDMLDRALGSAYSSP